MESSVRKQEELAGDGRVSRGVPSAPFHFLGPTSPSSPPLKRFGGRLWPVKLQHHARKEDF